MRTRLVFSPVVRRNLWLSVALAACGTHLPATGDPCTGPQASPALASSELANQLQESEYIFHGTVTQVHAKTVPDAIATTDLVIVHVDQVLFADAEFHQLGDGSLFVDADVTLEVTGAFPAVGDSAYFLSFMLEFNGGQLAVTELARESDADTAYAAAVPAVEALFADQVVYARVASADRIIAGTVTSVAPLANPVPCGSEHCPVWMQALVAPSASLCGSDAAAPVGVDFASSDDVAWTKAPKLAAGQTGVFLLHHTDVQDLMAPPVGDVFVISPDDVQPIGAEASLQALIASPPQP
ncbi:MAG TPA: hypothetical protein VMJ10_24355 [Kofleriaceae bacterium]|nr:hypothetical protein [Kofleriaceae bacterium]